MRENRTNFECRLCNVSKRLQFTKKKYSAINKVFTPKTAFISIYFQRSAKMHVFCRHTSVNIISSLMWKNACNTKRGIY